MAYRFTARRRIALKRAAIISGRKRRSTSSMKRDVIGRYRKRGIKGVPQRVKAQIRVRSK